MAINSMSDFENLPRRMFGGVGAYDVPVIEATTYENEAGWIGFNYAKSTKDRRNRGVHMFVDDYQFNRLWTRIDNYIPMLQQYRYVLSPDFSTYIDFPKAVQIFNHYKKHWCGAYMQEAGIDVIPTISWSTPDSFEWCFDGEPVGGVVAVSSVGTQNGKVKKALFMAGYNAMLERLKPETILFYGTVPKECGGNIVKIDAFQERFRKETS